MKPTRTDDTTDPEAPRLLVGLLAGILSVLVGWAALGMATVLIPLILAFFVTLTVLPLDRWIASRVPKPLTWLGRVGVMAALLVVIAAFIGGLTYCIQQIVANFPDVSGSLSGILPSADGSEDASGPLSFLGSDIRSMIREQSGSFGATLIDFATSLAQGVANATGVVLAGTILVLFLVLLALSEVNVWERKMDQLAGGDDWRQVTHTLGAALRRFLITRTFVGVISAAVYALWLWFFGLELLLVWAILTFLMNYIPNLGSLVSGIFPIFYAFLTLDFTSALMLGLGLVLIEQVIGNYLDPVLQGDQIALSPLVILIAVLFWGWLWGIAGAFLGTPMTLAAMILCNHIGALRPVALILSNQRRPEALDEALGWTPEARTGSA